MLESNFNPRAVGERLKKARLDKGYTQEQIVHRLGYKAVSTVSSHECGTRMPRPEELNALAILYGVSVDWLFTGEEIRVFSDANSKTAPTFNDRTTQKAKDMYTRLLKEGFSDKQIEKFIAMVIEIKRAAR